MSLPDSFKPGDVLSYAPSDRFRPLEGTAFVTDRGTAVDTFWRSRGDGQSHVLRDTELATAEVRFNVNDYDALDQYIGGMREKWETYHPDDRARITCQHGLQEELFIRKGASPDWTTQIANAEADVEDAESKLRSATSHLEWRRLKLAELVEKSRKERDS